MYSMAPYYLGFIPSLIYYSLLIWKIIFTYMDYIIGNVYSLILVFFLTLFLNDFSLGITMPTVSMTS